MKRGWKFKTFILSFVMCRGLKSNPEALKFIVGIDSVYKLRELFFKMENSPFPDKEMDGLKSLFTKSKINQQDG